ncbi:hypothetical protein BU24DRAFT_92079 [Aaosphaeria arxii CBS 175.79]|uniref:Uncharacterized protein n=1 Tax=Aaosphaeria arxii CBS 175.79 TaxID=1450172 RepID=A0A6A5X740_9PLEO|nr:uncharacterized protein BU24DRAFT_92079 [Aaosphaeria arxii CBS 175.79]KAF2008835.1 hypothetical protein BU24DRAFT_92079 [Aaosphaeria arxii CBS 175.79]
MVGFGLVWVSGWPETLTDGSYCTFGSSCGSVGLSRPTTCLDEGGRMLCGICWAWCNWVWLHWISGSVVLGRSGLVMHSRPAFCFSPIPLGRSRFAVADAAAFESQSLLRQTFRPVLSGATLNVIRATTMYVHDHISYVVVIMVKHV